MPPTEMTQGYAVLYWRHNERDGVSNHRRLDCLLNPLFRRRSMKTSGGCEGNYPVASKFPFKGELVYTITFTVCNII